MANRDEIGTFDVGTQSFLDASTEFGKGSFWQMGIAIDIVNRKFEFGKTLKYTLSADQFSEVTVNIAEREMGITHAVSNDVNTYPNNIIQYADKALLGPSTFTGYEGYSESIRITTAMSSLTYTNNPQVSWSAGVAFSLDKKNKYKYQAGDSFSVYGSGQAGGWYCRNSQQGTYGIKMGYSTMGNMSLCSIHTEADMATKYEANLESATHVALMLKHPKGTGWNAQRTRAPQHGQLQANSGKGGANFTISRIVDIWRDATLDGAYTQDNSWDFQSTNRKGTFRYLSQDNTNAGANSDYNAVAWYNINADASTGTLTGAVSTSTILGFDHGGGQFSRYSQALFTMVNNHSDNLNTNANAMSTGIFYQPLFSSSEDMEDASYSKLVGNTNYRLGLTWRGVLNPANGSNAQTSGCWAKFQWGSMVGVGDQTHAEYLSTPRLLFSDVATNNFQQNSWKVSMVSGAVNTISTDVLDTSWASRNLKIELISQVKSPQSYTAVREGSGAELLFYVDSVFLEHEGNIPGASGQGFVQFDTFPQQDTLTVNRLLNTKPATVILSDGTKKVMDTTGASERYLHHIQCDFNLVTQSFFESIIRLQEWQDKGHKLTLHPFLPQVPHTLVGQMGISNVQKSSWDLTRFSFRFDFKEND